jgi:hypothetical protein
MKEHPRSQKIPATGQRALKVSQKWSRAILPLAFLLPGELVINDDSILELSI